MLKKNLQLLKLTDKEVCVLYRALDLLKASDQMEDFSKELRDADASLVWYTLNHKVHQRFMFSCNAMFRVCMRSLRKKGGGSDV